MITIAIVDDDNEYLKFVSNLVSSILKKHGEADFEIKSFTNGNDLLKSNFHLDLMILDVDMPIINGFQLAEKLKHTENDNSSTELIYISNYMNFVFPSFKYAPLRFIRKAFIEQEMQEALNTFIEKISDGYFTFIEKKSDMQYRLKLSDIVYFVAFGHDICLLDFNTNVMHCIKKTLYNDNLTMNNCEEILGSKGFIRSHKSYLVNYRHIFEIKDNKVIFSNGAAALISSRNINDFKLKYQSWIMRY